MSDAGNRIDLRRAIAGGKGVQRPPWTSESRIRQSCVSCGDCIRACPENILIAGPANTPGVDFTQGECTFCHACADACSDDVFWDTSDAPWAQVAVIGSNCLLHAGIGCQVCTDSCGERALVFDLSVRPVGKVNVTTDACTGCGACLSSCPNNAISFQVPMLSEGRQVHG